MKIIKLLSFLVIILGVTYLTIDQNRSFYKLEEGKEITVWKRIGGKCYVIPYRYYGISKPLNCYIETRNTESFTLLWYRGKLIADIDTESKIVNKKDCNLENYNDNKIKNDSLFLWNDRGRFKLRSDLNYLSVYILDGSVYYNK
ncbi:hypothetical protein [Myroides odoratus]|uniref:Uncharacterized protein n=1 Tax=Myroides odoratus TaxID=256 RepID=A0A9Q7EA20_MYROD|nr:hypothetical protein [Myroides odoratus]EHQ41253.1 hypothetical protein Myrod_0416 [Myroides odoratus DSM 2801]EKB08520.1 hypothetical protein HMPREF9716_00927 [Myroides odoratus CIP 103059]QQT98699.1 hypothetical protein I6I88_10740 [Myroides odoratus]WQD59126.1 hypothetical protein U0010_08235 [Myroides odoratus]STZ32292.1 Uncharacterised protein [Myroides odoratus]